MTEMKRDTITKPTSAQSKEERVAEALRANLRRRKIQLQARQKADVTETSEAHNLNEDS